MKVDFFWPLTAQLDENINLFCLVFLTLEFFVCSILLTASTIRFQCFYIIYYTEVFTSSFISLYSLNSLFTGEKSS